MPVYFDCAAAGGDPTGRDMSSKGDDFPLPAQQAVIKKVVDEKIAEIESGTELKIKTWRSPVTNKRHILDGQHRFVACCIKGVRIELEEKKFGIAPTQCTWRETAYAAVEPAKEMLARNVARAVEGTK